MSSSQRACTRKWESAKGQKSSHDALGYEIRIQVIKSLNIATIDRTGNSLYHIHTLEDTDSRKRPSAFRDLAVIEVAKNYTAAEVARNLRVVDRPEDRKLLTNAGRFDSILSRFLVFELATSV